MVSPGGGRVVGFRQHLAESDDVPMKRKKTEQYQGEADQAGAPATSAPDREGRHRDHGARAASAASFRPAMEAYFAKCQEKLGFVPNVLEAYAFDNAKLEAFVGMYNDLMLAPSGLSKLEREMIAVAVSSVNRCYYCLAAHGAAVRALSGDPALGELMVMNYRAARLTKRHRAMLDFASSSPPSRGRSRRRPRGAAQGGLRRARHLGHRRGRGLLQHDQPRGLGHRHAAEQRVSRRRRGETLLELDVVPAADAPHPSASISSRMNFA